MRFRSGLSRKSEITVHLQRQDACFADGRLITWRNNIKTTTVSLRFMVRALLVAGLAVAFLASCELVLVPQKPDAVFALFRDRMKQDKVTDARVMLTTESQDLAMSLKSRYRLPDEPEQMALLSSLNPEAQPVVVKEGEDYAELQVRRLSGDIAVVRMTREDPKVGWKIDMTDELKSLEAFLEGKEALDMLRGLSGEFYGLGKAFRKQREGIKGAPGKDKEDGPDLSPPPKDKNNRPKPK